MAELAPCPSCRRHVHTRERSCPFCRASFETKLVARNVPETNARLSRAQIFAFATTLGLSSSIGCSSESTTPVYGAPAPDTGIDAKDSATTPDAADSGPDDTGGTAPLYGDPAPDVGADG